MPRVLGIGLITAALLWESGREGLCQANQDAQPAPPAKQGSQSPDLQSLPTPREEVPGGVIRAAIAKIEPSVVRVQPYGGTTTEGTEVPGGGGGGNDGGPKNVGAGGLTGVVVSEDGYILSSSLLLARNPRGFTIVLPDGKRTVGKLVGNDPTLKLCLLKADLPEGVKLQVPEMVPHKEVRIAQWAISFGYGLGSKNGFRSLGVISAINRMNGKMLQTDAKLSPACYGGPLIDIEGRLLGICSEAFAGAGPTGFEIYDSGVGFAPHTDQIQELVKRLKK